MPYKTDRLSLNDPFLDRRAKLLPCQKEMIAYHHARGASQRQLAAMFHVSRRLIQFIIDPDKHAANLEARNERGGSMQYYDREKHTAQIRNHRRYKYNTLRHATNQSQIFA